MSPKGSEAKEAIMPNVRQNELAALHSALDHLTAIIEAGRAAAKGEPNLARCGSYTALALRDVSPEQAGLVAEQVNIYLETWVRPALDLAIRSIERQPLDYYEMEHLAHMKRWGY